MRRDDRLRPYVPGFVVDWLREHPEARHRSVEGSLAFVDVSGFTTLTERLADRGKVGAEEMTGLLDSTFAELLAVAYSYGAWLVKWGGDAVLLLFQGDGHAERACTAALGMRRTMSRVGRLRTSAGPVQLRVSTGVHTGAFDFFLVGQSHRELVITGPGATTTAQMEALASAGQVAVSPATAGRLRGGLVTDVDGVLLLTRSPAATPGSVLRPSSSDAVDLGQCLPEATRQHLLHAGDEAEHRLVTVGFVEFSGVDALLAAQGPGAASAAVDAVVRSCQEAAVAHGVTFWETDISKDGGKVMLVAGAPGGTGADEDAMVAVARAVVDAGGALPVRVGVNRGRVFFGQFGPPYRRTMSVKGDAVNLAARLMARAAPGEVLASAAVLDRVRTSYATDPLPPFLVKGKRHQVHAARVGHPQERRGDGGRPAAAPLVGRSREVELLDAEWRVARAGRVRVCEVVGEAGSGKSRLVAELAVRTGARVVEVRCDPYTATAPYLALGRALRGLLGVPPEASVDAVGAAVLAALPADLRGWAPLAAAVVGGRLPMTPQVAALDDRFRLRRQEDVTVDLLVRVLPDATVVVVDDAHLLDPSTASLLERVTGRAAPWLVLRCRRDDAPGPVAQAVDRRLLLQPLAPSAALVLLHALTDDAPLAPHVEQAVVDRAGGNPLFLAELAGSAQRSGGVDLPDSVEGVVAARIDRLRPPDRALLRAAAVVGVDVDRGVLEELAGRVDVVVDDAALSRLAPFLHPAAPGTLRFPQALLQETAYEGLPFGRRALLHGCLGDVLAARAGARAEELADLLSLHFLRAGRAAEAWRYAQTGAHRAREARAHAEAAQLLERALTAARGLPERDPAAEARLYEALGDERSLLGQFPDAAEAYARARRLLPPDTLDAARVRYRAALCAERSGSYRSALLGLTAADRLAAAHPAAADAVRLQAQVLVARAEVRHWQGRHADAVRECARAAELAERAGATDLLADALVWLDVSRLMLGAGDGSEAERALRLLEQRGDRPWQEGRCLNELGIRAYFAGRWDDARRFYERCEEANARAGDTWAASVARGNAAEILVQQGRLDEAEPLLRDALRVWRASGVPGQVAFGQRLLGTVAGRRGDRAGALAHLDDARTTYTALGEDGEVVETDVRTAEAVLLTGDARAAHALATRTLSAAAGNAAAEPWLPALHRVHGLALAALGDVDAALHSLAASAEAAEARGADHELGFTLHALATVAAAAGRPVDARRTAAGRALLHRLGVRAVAAPVLRVDVPAQAAPVDAPLRR